jgi:hypothetical protein
MRRQLAVAVLTVSVAAGIVVGVAAHALTASDRTSPDRFTASAPPTTSVPSARTAVEPAVQKPGVEVKDPVLVSNTDGTATLSATLINHTNSPLSVSNAWGADTTSPVALLAFTAREFRLTPGVPVRIGGTEDVYRVRTRDRAEQGVTYRLVLEFAGEGLAGGASPTVFDVSVVPRGPTHDAIADNGPNTAVKVARGVVVVVPGQEKAYVGGEISNPIGDSVYDQPTAIDPRGRSLAWYHQTATGGPFGIAFTESPYLDDGVSRDADYFLAEDVTVGETLMVTIRYASGDVVAPFRVVQGNADGTMQAQ